MATVSATASPIAESGQLGREREKDENLLFKPVSLGAVSHTAIDNGNDLLHTLSVVANEPTM